MTSLDQTPPTAPVVTEEARDTRSRLHAFAARVGYWLPVFAVVVLFAQISFLGLRPALSEAKRLAAAEAVLTARHARACQENREIQLQLAARQDPVFLERQRRLRTIQPVVIEK
ncbi:MAG: hypothetical protein JNL28_15890 [Planctomycetes bacterium]|nr:hypothetical protein [Planctomycetota bacterium]